NGPYVVREQIGVCRNRAACWTRERKTYGAPSRRYGLCRSCFRFEDPGAQRSAQRTANACCHPEQPQLPKSRCQLAKGMYSNKRTVIFASAHPIICERQFNSFRLKRGG